MITRWIQPLAGALLSILLWTPPLYAQVRSAHEITAPWDEARNAYRYQDWPAAQRLATIAVQREPDEPRYYFALARITFQQGAVDDAVWFYDTFLRLTKEKNVDYPGSYAVSRAQAERESANARRTNPETAAPEPEIQRRVREAFLQRFQQGTMVTKDGGAMETFQTLIQVGYANPDFAILREALFRATIDEAEAIMTSNQGNIPALTLDELALQMQRYEHIDRLLPTPIPFDGAGTAVPATGTHSLTATHLAATAARRAFLRGQTDYMLGNFELAAQHFRAALDTSPDDLFSHQGLLNALIAQSAEKNAIFLALSGFETHHRTHPSLPIYKALAEQSARGARNAAAILYEILQTPP